jgi:hypothetical protein
MFKLPLLAIGAALLVSSCATRYSTSPPEPGVSPDPDALLQSMSARLASAKQYRITVSNTIPDSVAKELHQQPKNNVEVVVARPNRMAARITSKGASVRDMIFDGRTFTVVDGINNFYSTASLRGTLDDAAAQMAKIYGFQPPLAEFMVSDSYRDIKNRVTSISYLGKGTVNESGMTVPCHRIGLQGQLAYAELWLAVEDSLPRRMTVTRSNSGGRDLIVDIDFLSWDLNPQLSGSEFSFRPRAGAQQIPMISVEEANSTRN